MRKNQSNKGLVTQSLEHISKEIFSAYPYEITKLVEKSSGVYALYDEGELYYVGRATQLRTRVKQHLTDKHMAGWTHFSFFLVSNDDHIGDLESLLVRIANPKGNAVKPKGRDSRKMRKDLERLIKQKQAEELSDLFSKKIMPRKLTESTSNDIKKLVKKRTSIFRTYKGKDYKAILTPAGTIIYNGKKYSSPTAAAKAIVKGRVNGWRFWRLRDKNNEWVKLRDYNS